MFDNIGRKIKDLAVLTCWLGIIGSVLIMFAMIEDNPGMGILILVGGCLISWIGSFAAYALGEITENSERQVQMLTQLCKEQEKMNENLSKLQKTTDSLNNTKNSEEASGFSTYHLPIL